MDIRYKTIVDEVLKRTTEQIGERLKSAFIKGSVARGDALWEVSDLDFVLAFAAPTESDTALKRELEDTINKRLGQSVLLIQRIWDDRLAQYDAGTRAYWLYSCRHDIELLYGDPPASFLPEPPAEQNLVRLIAPIIARDGAPFIHKMELTRQEVRLLSKRTLQALALPAIAAGKHEFMAPLRVTEESYSPEIDQVLTTVKMAYCKAPASMNVQALQEAWLAIWHYVIQTGLINWEDITKPQKDTDEANTHHN